MKLTKLWSALLLAVLLLAAGLSGCAGAPTAAPTTGGAATAEPATAAPAAEPSANAPEPATITWVLPCDKQKNSDAVWALFNTELAKKLPNTTLVIQAVPWSSYADRIQMIISAKEDFDIMWVSDWMGDYLTKVNNGAFLPIGDLLEQHAPNIMKSYPPVALQAGKGADGKIYGLTSYQQLWRVKGLQIAKPIVDKCGIDMKKIEATALDKSVSTASLYRDMINPALELIFQNYPDLKMKPCMPYQTYMERTYEAVLDANYLAVISKADAKGSAKVVNAYKTQDFQDLIAISRDWFEKGYIPQDILTVTKEPVAEKGVPSVAFSLENATPDANAAQSSNLNTYGYEIVQAMFAMPYNDHAAGSSTMNFVNANSKNPERVIQFMDLMNSDAALYNLLCYGQEGQDYSIIADAKADQTPIKVNDPSTYGIADWIVGNVLSSIGQSQFAKDTNVKKWNEQALVSPLAGFRPDVSAIKSEMASTTAVINQYQNSLMYGVDSDYQKTYETFIQKLDAAGADKVIAELQKQVEAYEKANP